MDVAVLGAGPVGRNVTARAARADRSVNLHDAEATAVMDAIDRVERRLADAVASGDLADETRQAILARIDGTTGLEAAVRDAELVIETGITGTDALQERFAAIEELVGRETVLATTVTTGSVTAAAAGLRHPDRAIGIHGLDPDTTTVFEVVVAEQTTESTLERVESFARNLDLEPIVVRDVPGFASTRMALAAEAEAMRLVAAGVASVPDTDAAIAGRYDHAMGPLERADRAGLDRRLDVLGDLAESLGDRFRPPPLLEELVGRGSTGADAGEGFYVWEDGEPAGSALPDPNVVGRAVGPDDPPY